MPRKGVKMFEKEAEELEREYYGRRPTEPYSEDDSPNDWANIVQYAEENLNKAFKAITELKKELKKANEWHYVKDGIMPAENQWVLVYDGSYTVCNYHSNTPIKWLDNYENEVYEGAIIAWQEIVFPKEIKEND